MGKSHTQQGALMEANGVRFRVWAPLAKSAEVVIEGGRGGRGSRSEHRVVAMAPVHGGYYEVFVEELVAGARYRYRLDDKPSMPDPASRFQPEGVHGPSEVIDAKNYRWHDAAWQGVAPKDLIFYEVHVGTFTPTGTFAALRRRLGYLQELGINALELMPLHDFPGRWNWGYDPAAWWAPSRAYGRPDELRLLVDEAHQLGIAVFLDVVYNHLGPDGAYAAAFGPTLTARHATPWGNGINLDDQHAHGVRSLILGSALHWLEEYHVDGLRLDATFMFQDDSPQHILVEMAQEVAKVSSFPRRLIAEDNRNLNTLLLPQSEQGYGLHGVWSDDFHHQVRRLIAGDEHGYFADYSKNSGDLATIINQGWLFCGEYSKYYGKARGTSPAGLSPEAVVFALQNHDQVGNRAQGDRLTESIDLSTYRAVSTLLLFCPQLPLLFMGQEWAASTPFYFFTDHNETLAPLVREGRRREFIDFAGFTGKLPDPQANKTFSASKLLWREVQEMPHAGVLQLYRDLLQWRRRWRGAVQATSPLEGGLVIKRGEHTLLVALQPLVRLEAPQGSGAACWHSEAAAYTAAPQPPTTDNDVWYFPVPAALLLDASKSA